MTDSTRIESSEVKILEDDPPTEKKLSIEQNKLSFSNTSESELQEEFILHNLTRARASYFLALALITWVTAIGILGGLGSSAAFITNFRLGIMLPTICLLLLLATTYVPWMRQHYTLITSVGISIAGLCVIYTGTWTTLNGSSFVKITTLLVLVHATLVLGLRTFASTLVASVFVLGYIAISVFHGIPTNEIVFVASILITTATLCISTISSVEQVLRRSLNEKGRFAKEAQLDALTGVYNRRSFDNLVEERWKQAQREQECLQILLVDIDRFKYYNDFYGHQAGDKCLQRVAQIINDTARRPLDFCARYGGEEFAVVFYGVVNDESVTLIAEILREQIMEAGIPNAHSEVAPVVTVSIGSAILVPPNILSISQLVRMADMALFQAKRAGRNQVVHKTIATDTESNTSVYKLLVEQ